MSGGRWFDADHVAGWDDNPHRANPWRADQLDLLCHLAVAAWRPDTKVIDLACGTGHVIEELLRRQPAMQITAVDYSPVVLEQARGRLAEWPDQVRYLEHDLNQPIVPVLPAGGFDIAISVQSFHHFQDPDRRRQLEDIAALLAPDGLLLVHDRFAVADAALYEDYRGFWQHAEDRHEIDIVAEKIPDPHDPNAEKAAALPWFLEQLSDLGLAAAPFALAGTRALIVARKPGGG